MNAKKIENWMNLNDTNAKMARVATRQITGRRSIADLTDTEVSEILSNERISIDDIIQINF